MVTVGCKEVFLLGALNDIRVHDESLLNHKDRSVINKSLKTSATLFGEFMTGKITFKEQIIFYWNNLCFYYKIFKDREQM